MNPLVALWKSRALDLFKLNLNFFQNISDLQPVKVPTFFANLSDTQIESLIFLLFFIYLKEIPIFKKNNNLREKDASRILKLLKIFGKSTFEDILADSRLKGKIVQKLKFAFPHLVKPIISENGD